MELGQPRTWACPQKAWQTGSGEGPYFSMIPGRKEEAALGPVEVPGEHMEGLENP